MHKLTFYPLGNADCCRIDLENGRTLLFDYADRRNANDREDKRIDLPGELKSELERTERDHYDVVAFTHLDDDHVCGTADFFHFEHAEKYQGEGRIKIKELWVPATAIYDAECTGDARVIRQEARHRLRTGKGIRVFSRPERLSEWLAQQGLSLDDRRACITDAGRVIPGFTLESDQVEFFLHSPFAFRTNEGALIDRNGSSIVVQATFDNQFRKTKMILAADVTYDILDDIVAMTRRHNNDDRLEWDIVKLPHHCSYTAIGPDKCAVCTTPTANVKWLYEDQGRLSSQLVGSCWPRRDDDEDVQPPHWQAVKYYGDVARKNFGTFTITMEHPSTDTPKPLVMKIDGFGVTMEKAVPAAAASLASTSAPRAG